MVSGQSKEISQINHALVPKTHPPMYLMHKYWARKPHNVVAEYIKHYSAPGDVVLDPFLGSGVTLIEAIRAGRKAIGIDLDPISILITETTLQTTDLVALRTEFKDIAEELESKINDLYSYKCPKCEKRGTINYVVWSYVVKCPDCKERVVMADSNRPKGKVQNIYVCQSCKEEFSYANAEIIDEVPVLLRMHCPTSEKHSVVSKPKLRLPHIDLSEVWYPKIKFSYDGGRPFVTKRRASTIEELYTERNLYSLALIYDRITRIEDERTRKALQLVFSSTVPQTSKLVPWRRGFATGGPAWTVPEFLILPVHCEFNAWSRFANRFRSCIRGFENRMERLPETISAAKTAKELLESGDYYLTKGNALDLARIIPPNSVDYVFTDPPYGGAIQYFELDLIRAAWLIGKDDGDAIEQWWTEEITVNPRGQQKDFTYYHKMLQASFGKIYEVLKPGHYLTVTFHSTDIDVWNSIIMAVRSTGFELKKILYQSPAVRSARASLQPYGSAVGDYYIRFRKPEQKKEVGSEQVDRAKYERVVIDTTKKIIAERGEPTPFTYILNGIIPELDKQGVFFMDTKGAKGIEEVLRENEGVEFVLKPILDLKTGEELGKGWWFKDPTSISYEIPLSERVEKLVINTLNRSVKVSFDDVLQEVFIRFPNALTPNTQSVREILEEYASKTNDKKWILKPRFKQRMSQHDTIVRKLADLGVSLGFDVHADIEGFRKSKFPFPVVDANRVKNIDVVWYKGSEAVAIFEVENTTGITEAIVRGANIDDRSLLRVIVMPDERKSILKRKVREPILEEQIKRYGWKLVTYDDLEEFLAEHKKKPSFDRLMQLAVSISNVKSEIQSSLSGFVPSDEEHVADE